MPFPISKMLGGPRTPATGLPTPLVLQDISEFIAWHWKFAIYKQFNEKTMQRRIATYLSDSGI